MPWGAGRLELQLHITFTSQMHNSSQRHAHVSPRQAASGPGTPPAPPWPTPTGPTAVAGLRSSPFPRAEFSCRCLSCGPASAVPGGLSAAGSLSWAELDRLCAAAGRVSQSRSSLQDAVRELELATVVQVAVHAMMGSRFADATDQATPAGRSRGRAGACHRPQAALL